MPIEAVTYISDFVATNPVGASDPGSDLDNHIRNMKAGILATFPSVTGAVTPTHTQLNQTAGTWTEKQTFENYTLLGSAASGAPSIKMKKLTGTTNVAQGGAVNIAHGLTAAKIISITAVITAAGPLYVPPNGGEDNLTGYAYNVYAGPVNMTVTNVTGNSVNVVNKAITILLTYEE
jgi:hypothetical protein